MGRLGDTGGIHVSPAGLTGFADLVRREVTGNVTSYTGQLHLALGMKVNSGTVNPSTDLRAMIAKYNDCLDAINAQLAAYQSATETLIEAASRIAAAYRASDANAAAVTADTVNAALAQATAFVNAPIPIRLRDLYPV